MAGRLVMTNSIPCALAIGLGALLAASPSACATFAGYGGPYRLITLPPAEGGSFGTAGDALADGRLITVTGTSIYVETAPGSGSFAFGAALDSTVIGGAVDPSFLRVSPDGSRIALGAGIAKPLLIFDTSLATSGGVIDGANASVFSVPHFDAAWRNDGELAITAGTFGQPSYVSLLDVTSDPMAPSNPTIIDNIGGASAGVGFDGDGRLYTGNGFDLGPGGSATGWIKAFDPADFLAGPLDFEATGVFVADLLSANALEFDAKGNLFVGGGDFDAGDTGSIAIVNAAALADLFLSGAAIDAGDPSEVRRLDPRGDGFGFYGASYNGATGEVYVTDGGTWYATIPTPGGLVLLAGAALAASVRRRREVRR
ncbi:MAG: hypothetical protein VYC34_01415 [Planctomycetota bacterium]|nr:hypothetical protein [Planctomycetota bacterium]